MENLNLKGAKIAAIVVAIASIIYGLIPKTVPMSDQFGDRVCGSILFPGKDITSRYCETSVPGGLLWVVVVVSVAAAIYLTVKDNDENS